MSATNLHSGSGVVVSVSATVERKEIVSEAVLNVCYKLTLRFRSCGFSFCNCREKGDS